MAYETSTPQEQENPYENLRHMLEAARLPDLLNARRSAIKGLFEAVSNSPLVETLVTDTKQLNQGASRTMQLTMPDKGVIITGVAWDSYVYTRPNDYYDISLATSDPDTPVREFSTSKQKDPFRGEDYPSVVGMQAAVEDVITLQTLCDQIAPTMEQI